MTDDATPATQLMFTGLCQPWRRGHGHRRRMLMSEIVDAEIPLSASQRDALVETLLQQNPSGVVAAMDAEGRSISWPSSIQRSGQRTSQMRITLEMMAPSSRPAIYANLGRARLFGAATARVTLLNGVEAACHLVDVRHSHGAIVALITNESDIDLVASLAQATVLMPKTGRIEKDEVAMILAVDDRICRILGYEADELVGSRALDLIHPNEQQQSIDAWFELLANPGGTTRVRARHQRKDGSWLWMELTNTNLLDRAEGCVSTEMIDISEEVAASEHLRQREQVLTRLTEALPSGVLQLDLDRNVVYTNARLHRLVGVGAAATFEAQFATVAEGDRAALNAALDGVLSAGRDADVEVRLDVPGAASQHRASIAMRVLTTAGDLPAGALLCVDDVTEASALRAELQRRATIDELTGCLNRTAVLEALDTRLSLHRYASTGTTVLYLDLDGFKDVNDTFGHHAGDQLLTSVAVRISGVLRDGDVLGRLGGDEFIVVASGVATSDDAMQLAIRIRDALVEPLEVGSGRPMRMRSSIGVAWSCGPLATAASLTAAADRAMYQSKRAGAAEPVAVTV